VHAHTQKLEKGIKISGRAGEIAKKGEFKKKTKLKKQQNIYYR
jgi:hypothetical protein